MGELMIQPVSLPQCVTSAIKPVYCKSLSVHVVERYRVVRDLPEAEVNRAIANLERWMQPLERKKIMAGLGALKLMTSEKRQSQTDMEAQLILYAAKLAEWPADVVDFVLGTQADVSKWWPDWKELLERLEHYSRKNRVALKALRDYRDKPCEVKPTAAIRDLGAASKLVAETVAHNRQASAEMLENDLAERNHQREKKRAEHAARMARVGEEMEGANG